MVSCISIDISNTKGAIIFKISEQFTCFTMLAFVPRCTALADTGIYVTVLTVDIWTGCWTVSSIVFSWMTSFEKVMLLYYSLEYVWFNIIWILKDVFNSGFDLSILGCSKVQWLNVWNEVLSEIRKSPPTLKNQMIFFFYFKNYLKVAATFRKSLSQFKK